MSGDSKFICWRCNKQIPEKDIDQEAFYPFGRRYCSKCLPIVTEEDEKERTEYIRLKKKEMYKKALHILEIQNTNMYDYKEAAEVVRDKMEADPDKFDSSYEMLAAIILVKNRIYSKPQYKIGRYQVDFLLPEIGVVLEIDGYQHKYKQVYDNNREIDIRHALGPGWDIIRINTKYLDRQAVKLPEAINAVIEHRETAVNKWRSHKNPK